MRPAALLALVAVLAAGHPATARAQRALSPRLARATTGDSVHAVWVFAQPRVSLDALTALVTDAGGRVRQRSRFLHAVSADLPGVRLRDLAGRREVRRVQPVGAAVRRRSAPDGLQPPIPRSPVSSGADDDTLYGASWPYRLLNIPPLHQRGLRGAGVRIAIFDAGFNTLQPFLAGATVVAQHDFVNGDSVVRDEAGDPPGEHAHGTQVWSLLAANAPGRLFGLVPDAAYLLAKTEYGPTETRAEEDRWVAAVEWADSIGVDIIVSSVGYLTFGDGTGYGPATLTGDFAVTTIAADSAAARGILVVVAVGNDGPGARTLSTPADGDSVVAVGATDSLGGVMGFSSRGPTTDGRIKPDLIAPGQLVPLARSDSGTTLGSGTSFAAPLVAGLAALVQGTRPGQPAVDLRRGLLDGADRRFAPDNTAGFGLPSGIKLFAFPTGVRATGVAAGLLSTLTPVLSWDAGTPPPGEGPNTYRLKVGTDSTLGTLLLDTTVAVTSLSLPFAPRPATRLFWRVIATSAGGVVESTSVRGPLVVPAWVELLTLASPQGHSIRDSLPRFSWRSPGIGAPPGPLTYDVDVYPSARGPEAAVAVARGLTDTTFQPTRALEKNLPFRWRVVAHAGPDSVITTSPGTFVVLDESAPDATILFQNFPNPFPNAALGANATCIWFDVAIGGDVRLEIFDLRARLIRRLAPSASVPAQLPPGRYGRPASDATGTCDPRFQWDGRDQEGRPVRPGVYIYRLTAPGFRDSQRLVFLGGTP